MASENRTSADFFENGKPVDMLALQPDVANVEDTIMPYIYLNNTMLLAKYFATKIKLVAKN